MRTFLKFIGCSILALAGSAAFAANHAVSVGGSALVFTPSTLTINVGDSVTFTNVGGVHNVVADDNSFTSGAPTGTFTFTETFTTAGTFPYYCEVHGGPHGVGMSGTITVNDTAPPPPTGKNISPATSGSWFDAAQSGHGFLLQIAPGNTFLVYWFVFTPDGTAQSWLLAAGAYDPNSNTVTVEAFQDTGAKFPPNFNASDITQTDWGSLTFTFTDCTNGTMSWNSKLPGYGSGTLPITKLANVDGLTCN
ncbi:MAG TPA: plastocyanin/azurin family copper-binding protein [Rudaea sp.]|jgi:plastocyanin|nr:plastocyanin/azurin family copper-binding protein [Rudaea sp.]